MSNRRTTRYDNIGLHISHEYYCRALNLLSVQRAPKWACQCYPAFGATLAVNFLQEFLKIVCKTVHKQPKLPFVIGGKENGNFDNYHLDLTFTTGRTRKRWTEVLHKFGIAQCMEISIKIKMKNKLSSTVIGVFLWKGILILFSDSALPTLPTAGSSSTSTSSLM